MATMKQRLSEAVDAKTKAEGEAHALAFLLEMIDFGRMQTDPFDSVIEFDVDDLNFRMYLFGVFRADGGSVIFSEFEKSPGKKGRWRIHECGSLDEMNHRYRGTGFGSLNIQIRDALSQFCNVRHELYRSKVATS